MHFKTISRLIVLDLLPIIKEFLPEDLEDKAVEELQTRLKAQLSRQLDSHLLASRTSSAAALRSLNDGTNAILLSDQCVQQSGQQPVPQPVQQPNIAPGMVLPVPTSNANTVRTGVQSSLASSPQPPLRGTKRKRGKREQRAPSASDYNAGEEFSSDTEREVRRWRGQDAAIEATMRERHCIFDTPGYFATHSPARCDGCGIDLPAGERGTEGD